MLKSLFYSLIFSFAFIFHSTAGQHENDVIVEWAPFHIKQGVSEQDLLKASERLQHDFLEKQPGFVKRELLKGTDSRWVDLVYWASKKDADNAMTKATNSPVCAEYFGLMKNIDHNDPNQSVAHFEKKAGWQ